VKHTKRIDGREEKSVRADTIDLSLYYVEYALGSDYKRVCVC